MPLIESAVDNNPSFLKDLASFVSDVHSPNLALKKLGLSHHPSAARIQGYRDPLIAKISYHCDPQTLYKPAPAWDDIGPPKPPNPSMLLNGSASEGPGSSSSAKPQHAALEDAAVTGRSMEGGQQDQQGGGSGGSVEQLECTDSAMVPAASSVAPHESAVTQPVLDALARLENAEAEALAEGVAKAFDGAIADVFKSHVQKSLTTLLEEGSEGIKSSLEGQVLSARLTPAVLETLTFLRDDVVGSGIESAAGIGTAIARLSRGGWTFFQLVRKGVSDIVTPLNLRLVFNKSDWAIQPMAVLAGNKHSQTMTVSSVDDARNVVLCLDALPLEVLLRLYKWETQPELQYFLPEVSLFESLSKPDADAVSKALPVLLADLLAEGGFFLQGGDSDFKVKSSMLQAMQAHELVCCSEGRAWQLTERGKNSVKIGQVVGNYKRVVRPRDIALVDMEVAELMLTLRTQGWRHEMVHPKRCTAEPYVFETGAKVWYHDVGKESVSKQYLLLLATAEEHKRPVPHFASQRVCDELLGKESASRPPLKRSGDKLVFLENDELWVDESTLAPLKKKRQVRSSKATKQLVCPLHDEVLDGFPEAVNTMEPSLGAVQEDDVNDDADGVHVEPGNEQVQECQCEPTPSPAELLSQQAGDAANISSCDSSSDSSSESSASSSSSSSSSSNSSAAPKAKAKASKAASSKHRTRNMSSSVMWGACRLTPTKAGWQITCAHPNHNPVGATALCTKTRSNAISSEADALRMLKCWALWGRTAPTKDAHRDVWKRVTRALKNNTLPSMQDLDSNPVQDYPD